MMEVGMTDREASATREHQGPSADTELKGKEDSPYRCQRYTHRADNLISKTMRTNGQNIVISMCV